VTLKSVHRTEEGNEIEFQLNDGRQRKALIEMSKSEAGRGAAAPLPETGCLLAISIKRELIPKRSDLSVHSPSIPQKCGSHHDDAK
jgi:hypothetical protein